ncbi:hypothetical protein CDQ84_04615 [Clostridium thermosuccinogenes]|jgi:glycerophosphoryl diester phosphodiesterase|uniref:GP-PDE domain-containing protein n=1 Tax=Clostridium thermosuccinogenes TaxID=84032 RepID=A0A2K2FIV6_9CLOT|nr:glycerophosphodiester phosphodiesterase family protein [Pseudoclostridium thermosuccinogenes]AUS96136.1 hypothetical protein CDO33_06625 [Pseudoclostridium thermosuccinogenes]PNT98716.1 hypothetical protein CDQ85_04570 [Pseudoclostridium thermosuccinogenes]PNU00715.1 hypothetical protein CDQ84_04615 [Pseudoclostridium thermosuccinogenes]
MRKPGKFTVPLVALLVLVSAAVTVKLVLSKAKTAVLPAEYVAHGGGGVNEERITNSLEAFNENYAQGFRFFEADIEKTTDGHYILIHDWGRLKWLFNSEPEPCDLETFLGLKMVKGLTQMTLDDLMRWLKDHPDAYIITDAKSDNIGLHKYIKEKYPKESRQVIPQAMSFEEYPEIKALGYENIILTLYKVKYTPEMIIEFAENNELFAVTMHSSTAKTDFPSKLKEKGIFMYAHTINDASEEELMRNAGIGGIYTDFLQPD